jgi:heme-degrading monooxygenase HmoA
MIIERALMSVTPGSEAAFEAALVGAKAVVEQAKGFLGIEVARGIESPSTYLLLLRWETVEDHTVGFRESELFTQWRGHIGAFFADPPAVEHYDPIAVGGEDRA